MPDPHQDQNGGGPNRGNPTAFNIYQDTRPSSSAANTVSNTDQSGASNHHEANSTSSRPCSPPVLGPTARGNNVELSPAMAGLGGEHDGANVAGTADVMTCSISSLRPSSSSGVSPAPPVSAANMLVASSQSSMSNPDPAVESLSDVFR